MKNASIVLLVLFVMTMFLWLLILLGAVGGWDAKYSGWLPWFACLFLGAGAFASASKQ